MKKQDQRARQAVNEPIPDYGDHMTLDEFVSACREGSFINDDGVGYYATATHMSDKLALPSDIRHGLVDRNYSHVVWFKLKALMARSGHDRTFGPAKCREACIAAINEFMTPSRTRELVRQLQDTLGPFINHREDCTIWQSNPDGDYCTCRVHDAIKKANALANELCEEQP